MPDMTDPKIFENITKPMRYRASYQKKFYTVIWKNYDGTVLKTDSQIPALTAATPPSQPSKVGCDFIGWDKPYNKIKENIIITALFGDPCKFTVIWKNGDGTILKTEQVIADTSATPPSDPTMTGKTFKNWDKDYAHILEDTEITAVYDVSTYTVTWKSDSATVLKTETVAYGASATPPTPPAKTGKTFKNWDVPYTNITTGITITAVYEDIKFTVTWKGQNGAVLKTETVIYGTAATPPTPPTVTGKTFKNWDKSYSNIMSDTTITAVYESQTFTVTWKTDSGDVIRTDSDVSYGTTLTPPTPPEKTGYTFDKWDSTDYTITSDKTFIATYKTLTYTVIWKNWNEIILKTEQVEKNTSATPPSDPTREGYTFEGWGTTDFTITKDTTFIAQFSAGLYAYQIDPYFGVYKTYIREYVADNDVGGLTVLPRNMPTDCEHTSIIVFRKEKLTKTLSLEQETDEDEEKINNFINTLIDVDQMSFTTAPEFSYYVAEDLTPFERFKLMSGYDSRKSSYEKLIGKAIVLYTITPEYNVPFEFSSGGVSKKIGVWANIKIIGDIDRYVDDSGGQYFSVHVKDDNGTHIATLNELKQLPIEPTDGTYKNNPNGVPSVYYNTAHYYFEVCTKNGILGVSCHYNN